MRSVVLLSGGLDSVVNLKMAYDDGGILLALTFDYGQAAFESEERAAAGCARLYGLPHQVVRLPWFAELLPPAMRGRGPAGAHDGGSIGRDAELLRDGLLKEVWVPNRNGVLVSIGAAFAEALGAECLVTGFNLEEAEVFPDNSAEFVDAMNRVLGLSTLAGVRVMAYTQGMTKPETVKMALQIGAPLDLVYSCYRPSPEQIMCGTCQSCVRLKRALKANGLLEAHKGRFED